MLVRVWQDGDQDGLVDETVPEAGDFTSEVRQGPTFEGLEDGVFELYWAEFNPTTLFRPTAALKHKRRKSMLEKLFGLSKAGTSVKTEVMAGIATFPTMAYITVSHRNSFNRRIRHGFPRCIPW